MPHEDRALTGWCIGSHQKNAPRGAQIISIHVLACTDDAADVGLAGVGVLQRIGNGREDGL